MKLFTPICLLVIFSIYSVNGNILRFPSFFPSNNVRTGNDVSSPPPGPSPRLSPAVQSKVVGLEQYPGEEDSSESTEYRNEPDSILYNSSSEQEFTNSNDSLNSTEDNSDVIKSNVPSNASNSASVSADDKAELNSNDSYSKNNETNSSKESTTAIGTSNEESTSTLDATEPSGTSSSNITTNEQEEVILNTKKTSNDSAEKTFIQKSIDWVEDEYTLSILVPISAGILFALSIIITCAMCRCIRRCCRRRRFRKKVLPDSVKNLRPSDRARLLGDFNSSDDEF